MPVNQMDGPTVRLADLPLAVPFDSVKHYEDYIARLHQIPRVFEPVRGDAARRHERQTHAGAFLAREGAGPVRRASLPRTRFFCRLKKFPASISAADQQRLTKEITDAVNNEVMPAYQKFETFIATEYAPQGRSTFERHVAAGRQNALSERHPQPHHHQQSHSRADPRDRPARDRRASKRRCWSLQSKEGFNDVATFRDSLKTNPSTSRLPPSRFSMTSASTSRRCSPSCRSCSASFRVRRSRSRPCQRFSRATRLTIKPVLRTASGRAGSASPHPISRIAR